LPPTDSVTEDIGDPFKGSGSIAPGTPSNDSPLPLGNLVEEFVNRLADRSSFRVSAAVRFGLLTYQASAAIWWLAIQSAAADGLRIPG
jgi:hypothetical protein